MNSVHVVTTLLLIMDPLGNVVVFAALLKTLPAKRRMPVLLRELGISYLLILFFFFGGKYVLGLLNLSQEALQIAGGVILFLIALEMVFRKSNLAPEAGDFAGEPFVVPIATPMIAGPSLFAAIVILVNTHADFYWQLLALITFAWVANSALLALSPFAEKIFKAKGLIAVEKLMGMLLIALSVQMLLEGLRAFFRGM